jgi:hypothetical protein
LNRTPFNEVKSYLKKNSLYAKGLTIFDVLYPTTVTIKEPRLIQVIDRSVLAKVWDDVSYRLNQIRNTRSFIRSYH